MRNALRRIPGARRLHQLFKLSIARRDQKKKILAYLTISSVRKLHIGCGGNLLPDWLNSDYFPSNPSVVHLDATKPFPLEDSTFDYVFSEHMIEHITYTDGLTMLKECCRILKPGGRVRISTPNLKFLIDLYSEEKSELQKNYIKWASDSYVKNGEYSDTMVINNFVRDWGHLFIYDEKTLRRALEVSGFVDIVSHNINEGNQPVLKNLENEKRMPAGFLQLESFTLEARKA